jgi:phospholipid/cholesterol/gamma-HCH transport system permease protein
LAIENLGHRPTESILRLADTLDLLFQSLKGLGALRLGPVRQVFYRQIYFSGIQALSIISSVGALIGLMVVTQVSNLVGLNVALIDKVLVWTVVREMGPLFSAIVVIARSGTAVASELGAMEVNGEIRSLRRMGIDPVRYLVVPRVTGLTLCVMVLAFYFQILAISGGIVLSSPFIDVALGRQFRYMLEALDLYDIAVSAIKSLLFGVIISVSACYQGLRVRGSITEIPQATTRAVMQSLLYVIFFDGVMTLMWFL